MKIATTLEEARNFFLSHSSGSITCKKDGQEKECDCYPEAERFFYGNMSIESSPA